MRDPYLYDDVNVLKNLADIKDSRGRDLYSFNDIRGLLLNEKISKDVGVSTATIGRVSKCLKYGSGGYRNAIDGLKKEK